MTNHPGIDRVLEAWMADGPTTMPDQVVDLVADRIGRQPQRHSRRTPPWRSVDLAVARSPLTIVTAVLVFSVFGAIMLGRPAPPAATPNVGSATPGPTPSTSAATFRPTTPPPATVGSDWWRGSGCGPTGEPRCAGPLAPGINSAGDAIPGLTFSVPAGWVNTYEYGSSYTLVPDTAGNRQSLAGFDGAVTAIDLVREDLAYTVECTSDHRLRAFESSDQAMDDLADRVGLDARNRTAVSADGLSGAGIDLSLPADAADGCQYDVIEGSRPDRESRLTYAVVLEISTGSSLSSAFAWIAVPGQRLRVIVLDLSGGGMVLIRVYARDAADFEGFVAAAMPIIESIGIDR